MQPSPAPPRPKMYLMSVACSGKSTFAGQQSSYGGYKVVDVADLLPAVGGMTGVVLYFARVMPALRRLVKNSAYVVARRPDRYEDLVFSFLRDQREPTVLMARRAPEDLRPYDDITFGAVLIPLERHRLNCQRRRRQLRNPLPFFDHPSTNFRRIMVLRDQLERYARRHGLPMYESFAEAIDELGAQRVTPGNARSCKSAAEADGVEP